MENKLYKTTNGNYNLLMAYPAIESFALASLGYLWLYKIADEEDGINALRCATDNIINYKQIDSIAFSMSFDFDFMGVFEILEKLNIPFYTKDRNENHPIIFAGGPVLTTNPRPYEQFFDFMMIGDGDENFKQVLNILKNNDRQTALKLIKDIDGIYIPNNNVKKATVKLNEVIYTPILSDKGYFKDTFIIEVARGCMNRCAFCTASYLNLPFRANNFDKIIEAIELGLRHTNKIALLGAQISAHPEFNKIMEYLSDKIDSGQNIEIGISSLRTDSVTPQMVQTLVKGGQKHSTIAIEAASERLRKFINKNLKEEQIINAVKVARENGLKGLKIYSMIGIPNENYDDLDEFMRLGKKIKNENKGFNIEFSFSSFVPKPNTPFQWSNRENTKSLEKKQKYLEKELAKIGISAKFSSIKWDYWQSVISRADENFAPFLVEVYKEGGKIGAYKSALKSMNLNIKDNFDFDEQLPWDIISLEPRKELLINEYKRLEKRL